MSSLASGAPKPPVWQKSAQRLLLASALVIVVALLVIAVARVLLVIFAGALVALLLRAGAKLIARATRMPVWLSLTLLVLFCTTLTVVGLVLAAPTLGDQFQRLRQELPAAIAQLRSRLPAELSGSKGATNDQGVATAVHASSGVVMSALGNSIEVLSSLVVIFFIAVYGAAQPQQYMQAFLALTPKRHRERVTRVLERVRHDLTRWLVGRLIAMAFVGITTTLAFHFLQLPLAIILGILAGLLTFIEYAGAVVSAIPPLLLALSQDPARALWVLVIYTGLHVIEGYILTPLLARAAVHLPPAITLSTQVIFSVLVGPLGLTFSTPLLVLAISATKAWRNDSVSVQAGA